MSDTSKLPIQDTEDYVAFANSLDSAGTDSGPARARLEDPVTLAYLIDVANEVIRHSERMDLIKKKVFYGKDFPVGTVRRLRGMEYATPDWAYRFQSDNRQSDSMAHDTVRLFHAICGWVTESGELLKMFMECLAHDKPFDRENIMEEVGDGSWYQALFAKYLGLSSLLPILRGNYGKLVKRYGTSWNEYGALNQNVPAELAAMNKGVAWTDKTQTTPIEDMRTLAQAKPFTEVYGKKDGPASHPKSGKYETLEQIVGQLSFVDYQDPQGHKLTNNAAFMALVRMAKGE